MLLQTPLLRAVLLLASLPAVAPLLAEHAAAYPLL
jgi:hypothetical protein